MDSGQITAKTADGVELIGRYWPATDTRAVMALVHGFGEHAARYAPMAAHLNAQGISVVAVDLRGHGESPGPRGILQSYDDMRADVTALLASAKRLYPYQPLILYGHSMGGGAVLDHGFTPDVDVLAIIASAPLIGLPKPPSGLLRGAIKLMGRVRPQGAASQPIKGDAISSVSAEQIRYVEDPLNHGKLGFRTAAAIVENGEAIAARAKDWTLPLLLVHARNDELTSFASSEAFAASAPNTEFHAFEDCAHEIHNDVGRARVYDLMTEFILRNTT